MSPIKNTIKLHHLNAVQQKGLKIQLNKLDLQNKLLLTLNKKIEKFPHNKVNDKLGGSLNQNIIFNFSNKNVNTSTHLAGRLISKQNLVNTQNTLISNNPSGFKNITGNSIKLLRSQVSDLGSVLVKTPSRLGILNNVVKILTSYFNGLSCLIARPQFIDKTDKLIVRIFYYQNKFNKASLFSNNKSNFIFNLFNGTASAKAQYSAPKSQNFSSILRDMLGQTKWNKIAHKILNNNEAINCLELANISKKVFILFIKDLMNLTVSNKEFSIEKALTQLQKGSTLAKSTTTPGYKAQGGLVVSKRYNQLLMKLVSSTNSEALTSKRTRLSKIFFNKSLLSNLRNKVIAHNNSLNSLLRSASVKGKNSVAYKELIGKGMLMNPVTKGKFNNLLEWSPNKLDLSAEYKIISKALLVLLEAKNMTSDRNASIESILAAKINNNLISLSRQFADGLNHNTNFIARTLRPFNSVEGVSLEKGSLLAKFSDKANNLPLLTGWNKGVLKLINNNLNATSIASKNNINGGKLSSALKDTLLSYKFVNNNNNAKNNILTPSGSIGDAANVYKFKLLGTLLSKIFNKNIDLQLIKLHNAGLEAEILAKIISENAKFDKSSVLLKKLWRKINLSKASLIQFNKQNNILNGNTLVYDSKLQNQIIVPVFSKLNNKTNLGVKLISAISDSKKNINLSQLHDQIDNLRILHSNPLASGKTSGLNIRIAGRLQKEAIKPKQTVKSITAGTLSKDRTNTASLGSFTSKNRKGSFRISIKMGHIRTFATSTKQLDKITFKF